MDAIHKQKLRNYFRSLLDERGDHADFRDDQSLFLSGRLDSLAMTRVVVFLEEEFGISFAHVSFDVDLIDSIQSIETFMAGVAEGQA